MSVKTEIIAERIATIDATLLETKDDSKRNELIEEKSRLIGQLATANNSLKEGKQLLKG